MYALCMTCMYVCIICMYVYEQMYEVQDCKQASIKCGIRYDRMLNECMSV